MVGSQQATASVGRSSFKLSYLSYLKPQTVTQSGLQHVQCKHGCRRCWLAHRRSAALEHSVSNFLADLDAQQAACNAPSAMLAAEQQKARDALADIAQRRTKMANIQLEYHEVWLGYCQRRLGSVAARQAAIDGRAWLARHQAWLAHQQGFGIRIRRDRKTKKDRKWAMMARK